MIHGLEVPQHIQRLKENSMEVVLSLFIDLDVADGHHLLKVSLLIEVHYIDASELLKGLLLEVVLIF